jgi:hypothetical protein
MFLSRWGTINRYAWGAPKVFLKKVAPEKEPIPGAVITIQSFGDFLGFNSHCHILVTDFSFFKIKDHHISAIGPFGIIFRNAPKAVPDFLE